MTRAGIKRRIAERLRIWADRLSPETAPRHTGMSFTFEPNAEGGIRIHWDDQGCPLWYLGEDDYARAHDEADTEHTVIMWANLAEGRLPSTRRAGGRR